VILDNDHQHKLCVSVCVGTSCFIRGSQSLLKSLVEYLEAEKLDEMVEVRATFCFERCDRGPTIQVGQQTIEHCTLDMAVEAIQNEVSRLAPTA
jgi:NADH-quinone oxidoreductase subunit G